jgi:hypothetical protein
VLTDPAPSGRDYAGVAAVILAVGLVIGWSGALVLTMSPFTHPITDGELQLLGGIGQVLAGSLATFLGARITASVRRERTLDDAPN